MSGTRSIQRRIRRKARRRRKTNSLAMFFVACIIVIFGVVMFRSISYSSDQLHDLQNTEQQLENELAEQEQRAGELEEQRVYVKTKAYVEEAAKKLGLVYPEEVIFKPAE